MMKHAQMVSLPRNSRVPEKAEEWWCWGIGCLFMPQWWENKGKEYPAG